MDTDLNDLPAWAVQRMNDKDAEIDRLRAENERLRGEDNYVHTQDVIDELVRERADLRAQIERLSVIRCPDGQMHQWNGDGQCRNCCNYATDLIDKALRGEGD